MFVRRRFGQQTLHLKRTKGHLWLLLRCDQHLPVSSVTYVPNGSFHSLSNPPVNRPPLLGYGENDTRFYRIPHQTKRGIAQGLFIVRVLKGVLRVRYLLLGGAVGGGYSLNKVRRHSKFLIVPISIIRYEFLYLIF
jgi:hypothetical protein